MRNGKKPKRLRQKIGLLRNGQASQNRNTTRKTKIDVYKPIKEKGGIYEMGIYIQDTEMPYDININQKVPLPPTRDIVSNSYLQARSC